MVSDGNRTDGFSKISGVGDGGSKSLGGRHVGGGLGCDSCGVFVVLYQSKGGGVHDASSGVAKLAWISLLGSRSKLEYQRSMV